MDELKWLDAYRAELEGHQLPNAYIRHSVAELRDHALDIMEEGNMTTESSSVHR